MADKVTILPAVQVERAGDAPALPYDMTNVVLFAPRQAVPAPDLPPVRRRSAQSLLPPPVVE
jgi:hypothetical protein